MLEIQKNIETLKEESKNRLEELKNDELTLAEEVATYENKIPEWEKPVNIKDTFLIVPKRISTSANNLCQVSIHPLCFNVSLKVNVVGSKGFSILCSKIRGS